MLFIGPLVPFIGPSVLFIDGAVTDGAVRSNEGIVEDVARKDEFAVETGGATASDEGIVDCLHASSVLPGSTRSANEDEGTG